MGENASELLRRQYLLKAARKEDTPVENSRCMTQPRRPWHHHHWEWPRTKGAQRFQRGEPRASVKDAPQKSARPECKRSKRYRPHHREHGPHSRGVQKAEVKMMAVTSTVVPAPAQQRGQGRRSGGGHHRQSQYGGQRPQNERTISSKRGLGQSPGPCAEERRHRQRGQPSDSGGHGGALQEEGQGRCHRRPRRRAAMSCVSRSSSDSSTSAAASTNAASAVSPCDWRMSAASASASAFSNSG